MDLLGVGPLELLFVLLIIFLVLGPNDLAETGKKIGRFLSTVRKSEFWRGMTQVSKEVRSLPTTLIREAELEDFRDEMKKDLDGVQSIAQEFNLGELREITPGKKSSVGPETSSQDEAVQDASELKPDETEDQ